MWAEQYDKSLDRRAHIFPIPEFFLQKKREPDIHGRVLGFRQSKFSLYGKLQGIGINLLVYCFIYHLIIISHFSILSKFFYICLAIESFVFRGVTKFVSTLAVPTVIHFP